MEAEDLLGAVVWALPFLAIAGVFHAIALWKRTKGRGLHERGRQLVVSGDARDAREARGVLLAALWKANEEPLMERRILADLDRIYREAGVAFSPDDYEVLIRQFEALSRKGSNKALGELKKVQGVKHELIGRMPPLP